MRKATILGFALAGFCFVRGLAGCGNSAAVECTVRAVKFLPDDPQQLTPYDVADLVGRLHACKVPAGGDAGQ